MSDFERVSFRIDPELKAAAAAKAKAEDLTLSQVIRRFLREWVQDDPPKHEDRLSSD